MRILRRFMTPLRVYLGNSGINMNYTSKRTINSLPNVSRSIDFEKDLKLLTPDDQKRKVSLLQGLPLWLKECLECYRKIHGDLLVPFSFTVPDDPLYPASCKGKRLGQQLTYYRRKWRLLPKDDRKVALWAKELKDLGMVWEPKDLKFELIYNAIAAFKLKHGHTNVPYEFEIKKGDPDWPEQVSKHGLKLGYITNNIRNLWHWSDDKYVKRLVALEFNFANNRSVWTPQDVKAALKTYKALHGHLNVPKSFIVPFNDLTNWTDAQLWGMHLGELVSTIRSKNNDSSPFPLDELKPWLKKNGFVWNVTDHRFENVIKPALKHYMSIHGNLDVPKSFEIGLFDENWPEATRGLKLGRVCSQIRHFNKYRKHRAELEKLGFIFLPTISSYEISDGEIKLSARKQSSANDRRYETVVKPALLHFQKIFGHVNIPHNFVVPSKNSVNIITKKDKKNKINTNIKDIKDIKEKYDNDANLESWPALCHGLRLGSLLYRIRRSNYYKRHKHELKRLGILQDDDDEEKD